MPEVKKNVLIEFTPEQMFDLVDQCESYPEYLPWCGGAVVHQRTETITEATLQISYHGIKSKFSTRNQKKRPEEMTLHLTEGPFTRLEGRWHFIPLGDTACKIEFELSYQFSSKLLEKVLGPVFKHIADTFVEAFVKRAEKIYPKGK